MGGLDGKSIYCRIKKNRPQYIVEKYYDIWYTEYNDYRKAVIIKKLQGGHLATLCDLVKGKNHPLVI